MSNKVLVLDIIYFLYALGSIAFAEYWTRSDEFCEHPLLEKLHFHVALEEVRVTELLSYYLYMCGSPRPVPLKSLLPSEP